MLFQDFERLCDIHRFKHLKPGILKDAGRVHQDEGAIVDDEVLGRSR